jgi:Flp pilus assembly protein TadG
MMILAIAVLDFSRISYYRFLVADASGAASRYAAFHPVTDVSYNVWMQQLDTVARNTVEGSPWASASALIVHPAEITVVTPGEKRITVKTSYVYRATLPWPGLPTETTVSNQVNVVGAK